MRNTSKPPNLFKSIVKGVACLVLLLCLIVVGCVAGYRLRMGLVENIAVRDAAPSKGRWVLAHDVNIYMQEFGLPQGKPLVLVHGTGAWSGTWGSNVPALVQAGFRVIAIDLPPFGFTERAQNLDYSRSTQAKRILAVIENLGIDSVTLLGHSFGGGPAAEAAMVDGRRVAHLVLVDAAIGLKSDGVQNCEPPKLPLSILGWRPLRTTVLSAVGTNPLLSEY
jgi:pimeloyl-ACP methyl ester carboxylesterase